MPEPVEPTFPHLDRPDAPQYPPPIYTPSVAFEHVREPYRYPSIGAPGLRAQPAIVSGPDEPSLPLRKSLPLAFCATLFLNVPAYYSDAMGSHAWDAKAIEYGISVGCVGTVAYILLAVERGCAGGTLREWKLVANSSYVEAGFLLAFTIVLSPCAPRLGHAIATVSWEGLTWKIVAVPAQIFLTALPTFVVVMSMLWLMSPSPVVIVREDGDLYMA